MGWIFRVLLFIFLIPLGACKEPAPQFIFVENGTSFPIVVMAHFQSNGGSSSPLTFKLQPGQQDGWRYLNKGEALDKSFLFLTVSTDKCVVRLDRHDVEKTIRKNGVWTLLLEDSLTVCKATRSGPES